MSIDELSLGATIRSWRDRVDPASVGRARTHGGRAPGLRREDLAELAGLSVDYVVRLEQGRATNPSAQVAAALARALQLSVEERDHLFRLAGLRAPGVGMISDHVPPGMQRILGRLGDAPVAVFAADWQLVWWNDAWSAVLGDPGQLSYEERNRVHSRFPTNPEQRPMIRWPVASTDTDATDLAIVADLRRASGRYPDDVRLSRLVRASLDGNARFARLWGEGAVRGHTEDRKTIRHPTVGDITVDCDVLVDTETELKIVVYTTLPGSEDETKLDLARVMGTTQERPL